MKHHSHEKPTIWMTLKSWKGIWFHVAGIIAILVRYKPLRITVGMQETWEDFTIRKPPTEK